MPNSETETVLILDYGSQFTQLIARVTRQLGVYCEIHPHHQAATAIRRARPIGIILSGGPQSILTHGAARIADEILNYAAPTLGICYGMQAMAQALGGEVKPAARHEYGKAVINTVASSALFSSLPPSLNVWMSHGDYVTKPPPGFAITASSPACPVAAMENSQRRWYGLQFHPEVAHTQCGRDILSRFIKNICAATGKWTMPNFVENATYQIRDIVGKEGVLLALSGGVDSAVLAALLQRAIGHQLHCVLVDNGLMREAEVETIRRVFTNHFNADLTVIDAAKNFFTVLRDVTDAEEKRRRIGAQFIREFEKQARIFGDSAQWLAQGTIYPDVVESAAVAGGNKATIKSHHNVGGLPKNLNLKLLEPLRELFKDEVRAVGEVLGLPSTIIRRHPFPGPGLAVRVLGEVTDERARIARQADAIFTEELAAAGLDAQTAQAFVVLLPVNTVGVMGDARTYENVAALRAVTTDDFMTADWAQLPYDFLARVSSRITNTVVGINRVVYDISSKPPATIEWE